ncbi:MAG: apolipoprotein N-acyltransferase [Verrucomicrobia bacterium]|nr:MAG: apolipoprotein N-acyltransferase [Verrucomicrobiota bacterium]
MIPLSVLNLQWTEGGAAPHAAGMPTRKGWMRVAGAISSGLLVVGLFPPFHAVGLAWLALLPLLPALWSLEGKRAGLNGFGLGWLAGSVSSGGQFYWLGEVSWLAAGLLPLYLGLFWGVFGAFAATLGNPWHKHRATQTPAPCHSRRHRLLAAVLPSVPGSPRLSLRSAYCHGAIWAGLEWLRSWLFSGFGWNPLGVAFHDSLLLAQAADLLGVIGLSLLLVFCQAVMVQAAARLLTKSPAPEPRQWWDVAAAVLIVALVLGYGSARLQGEGYRKSVRIRSLLVQLDVPQEAAAVQWDDLKITAAYEDDTLAALEAIKQADALSGESAVRHWPDWVLWPEGALRGQLLRTADGGWGTWQQNLDTIAQVRRAGPFTLIYGINEMEALPKGEQLIPKPDGRIYNSLAVMSPSDELQTFRKHHLVIFGETIPLVDSLPFLKQIYEQQSGTEYNGSFTPGDSFEPLTLNVGGRSIGAIPSVCFEDSVPRLLRQFARPGPQVILNVTNDGWFKHSAAAAQHFANARFRAIELRRPMLRCANTGVSAAISSCGSTAHPDTGAAQVLSDATGSHFTRGTLLTELDVPLEPAVTLYAVLGDGGIILLALLALGTATLTRPGH